MGSVDLVLEMITDVDKTHYSLLCCGEVVTKLWKKEFETPGNDEPDLQPALLLEIQDDGGEVPYTHRREWSFFVR